MYIRDANIIIVVYDITSTYDILIKIMIGKDSFLHTSKWLDEVKDLKRGDAIFALVGNKLDLGEKRLVTSEEAMAMARERNIIYHEVSAKTGENINSLFYKDIFDQIIASFKKAGADEEIQSNNY